MSVASAVSCWLIIASERRELANISPKAGWSLLASGPGSRLVTEALRERRSVEGIVSVGFCGALDPSLKVGDIVVAGVVSGDDVESPRPFIRGQILCSDRVAVTAAEKRALHQQTGAIAVDMESVAVAAKARDWGVPFRCIKAVSDTANQDMPLDFNELRDPEGRFSRGRIAMAALRRPFAAIPALLQLDRNCRKAAEALGEFLADCKF